MFLKSIDGINQVFETDADRASVILVRGGPGTLKSAFVHSILSRRVTRTDEYGMYILLEETKEKHLANMRSLGIKNRGKLHLTDYTEIREELREKEENVDFMNLIENTIHIYLEDVGDNLSCVAIDSLNALYALMDASDLRNKMYHFFKTMRDMDLTTFAILEMNGSACSMNLYGGEEFLADGIIEMGIKEMPDGIKRYLQVNKMKAVKHSLAPHLVEVKKNGLHVIGQLLEV